MSLFKRFKDWFNAGDDTDDFLVLEKPLTTKKDATVETVVKTEPLTVKPKKKKQEKSNRETKASLEKMTKVQIDELAAERFGVQLDRRNRKETMISEFMKEQRKAK